VFRFGGQVRRRHGQRLGTDDVVAGRTRRRVRVSAQSLGLRGLATAGHGLVDEGVGPADYVSDDGGREHPLVGGGPPRARVGGAVRTLRVGGHLGCRGGDGAMVAEGHRVASGVHVVVVFKARVGDRVLVLEILHVA